MATTMNRRAALRTLLGAALLPTIKFDFARDPEDLSGLVLEFCDWIDHPRYDLRKPWEFRGDSVASDARALIRVPGLAYMPTGERGPAPDCDELFRQFWRDDCWLPLPPERLARNADDDQPACPFCLRHDCGICGGVGSTYGLDDRSHVCHQCGGHGYVARPDCELCHGDERFHYVLDASFGVPLNARYARLARRIPGAMWRTPLDKDGPVLFRGDGGVAALVMQVVARVEGKR